ncbi:MAG: hypothetical protein IRY99_06670 [Isosphaeraceae bacterium]|nr:hypothetical protein [Isosphaeraceae bacterium]
MRSLIHRHRRPAHYRSAYRPTLDTLEERLVPTSVRFAVIGDYGNASQLEQDVANLVHSWNPNFIITTGDNNYAFGSAETIDANIGQYYHDFIAPYHGQYGTGSDVNRFFPSLGNHDWYSEVDTTTGSPRAWQDYFTGLPGNGRYYDFVRGPVHFFALDSTDPADPDQAPPHREPDGSTADSIQGQWLRSRLAAATEPWKVVYFHHAPFSSGTEGSVPDMQWPFQAWGATSVLAGHNHDYERILRDGIPYFVNGLGGNYYISQFDRDPVPGTAVRYNADYGAMLVDADETRMTFQFITRTGQVIDTYTQFATSTRQQNTINFNNYALQSYGGAGQDIAGAAAIEDSGATLHLSGNTWKKITLPYTVTPDTVLEFDFKSPAQGEVQGIGLDDDDNPFNNPPRTFALYGTQPWGLSAFHDYAGSAPDWKHYIIPVGQYYTGAMNYLTFTMDQDVDNPTGEAFFRNIRLYEAPHTGPINFNNYALQSYGGAGQDIAGAAAIEDSGATLHLSGNTWKKITLPYTVTPDTVLEFDFKSPAQGEVQGIGLDDDDNPFNNPPRTFALYGTQPWGLSAFHDYAGSAPDWKHYIIPVGQYYTGAMNYLTFTMDQDVDNPTGEAFFRNIRLARLRSS